MSHSFVSALHKSKSVEAVPECDQVLEVADVCSLRVYRVWRSTQVSSMAFDEDLMVAGKGSSWSWLSTILRFLFSSWLEFGCSSVSNCGSRLSMISERMMSWESNASRGAFCRHLNLFEPPAEGSMDCCDPRKCSRSLDSSALLLVELYCPTVRWGSFLMDSLLLRGSLSCL